MLIRESADNNDSSVRTVVVAIMADFATCIKFNLQCESVMHHLT